MSEIEEKVSFEPAGGVLYTTALVKHVFVLNDGKAQTVELRGVTESGSRLALFFVVGDKVFQNVSVVIDGDRVVEDEYFEFDYKAAERNVTAIRSAHVSFFHASFGLVGLDVKLSEDETLTIGLDGLTPKMEKLLLLPFV